MSKVIEVEQQDGGGNFPAYCAEPAGAGQAAIVVIQEIFGINAGIRRKCDKLAEAGYLALAPDLFWRIAPGIELDPDIEPQLKQAFELMKGFDQDQAVQDIQATIKEARGRIGGSGKVGAVGYCLGGRLAFMTAMRSDVDASVGYYGGGIDKLLGEKDAISHPFMLHLGENDEHIDRAAQARIHKGLDGHPKVTIHDYPGAGHGFATEFGARRSEADATLADERTANFFAQYLS